jgi:hypothetical protein
MGSPLRIPGLPDARRGLRPNIASTH